MASSCPFFAKGDCKCRRFLFAPGRPEDFGEFWLPKRRDFVREAYRMKCRCKHTHEDHDCYPAPHRCRVRGCACSAFTSASVCAACDQHWELHDTVFETEAERKATGRQISKGDSALFRLVYASGRDRNIQIILCHHRHLLNDSITYTDGERVFKTTQQHVQCYGCAQSLFRAPSFSIVFTSSSSSSPRSII